jgi:hypothetical protein
MPFNKDFAASFKNTLFSDCKAKDKIESFTAQWAAENRPTAHCSLFFDITTNYMPS